MIIAQTSGQPTFGRAAMLAIFFCEFLNMNTQQELQIAFDEYRNGTFIKHKPV